MRKLYAALSATLISAYCLLNCSADALPITPWQEFWWGDGPWIIGLAAAVIVITALVILIRAVRNRNNKGGDRDA